MDARKLWSRAIPTGSCWGLFGGALMWAPTATIGDANSGRSVGGRRDTGTSDVVAIIDLAAVERRAPQDPRSAAVDAVGEPPTGVRSATSAPLGAKDHPVGGERV
jgi:hypothetical protein